MQKPVQHEKVDATRWLYAGLGLVQKKYEKIPGIPDVRETSAMANLNRVFGKFVNWLQGIDETYR